MCGIAGYFQTDGMPASHAILEKMLAEIAHRGPDGKGSWLTDGLALGHTRLAIIDLSDGGRQPMQTPCGRYTITYNGEIYNYLELKTELRALGHRFQSESDTEVILVAVLEWGLDAAIDRLNGIFAIALWDAREKRLHLARDRFGVKPLYWTWSGQRLVFGSEIKALLAHPDVSSRLNPNGLREYLTFQNFHSAQTLFAGIEMLPPGGIMTLELGQNKRPEARRYYMLRFRGGAFEQSEDAYREELRHLFRQAVERQLISDVEVAGFLSGGIDSGAIVSIAAQAAEQMHTFTCGFDLSSASGMEMFFDERRPAEMMSAIFATQQYEIVLKSGDMERVFPALVRSLEEPRVGQCYPNYLVSRLAAKFNKVVLAGTGGDELFGGYPWRYAQSLGPDAATTRENTFRYWHRLFAPGEVDQALAPIADQLTGPSPREIFDGLFPDIADDAPINDRLNAVMTYEANTFLPGLLVIEDKVSMAHGLEARVPFLDNDLVEFATRLPVELKVDIAQLANSVGGSGTEPPAGKVLLREVVSELIPDEIAKARKQGFSAPDASWFRGASMEFVKARILDDHAKIYNVVSKEYVRNRLDEHFSGQRNNRLLIWSMLHIEEALSAWSLV